MIKTLAQRLITIYQHFVSPTLHQLMGVQTACRYPITCSEYAKQVIASHGVLRGSWLALKRIAICQPFAQVRANA